MPQEQMAMTVSGGEELLSEIESELEYCLRTGYEHIQTALLLISKIRYDKLYLYARDEDGSYMKTWEQYVSQAINRFNISRGWIFRNVKLYRIGISLGFTDEELLEIEPLSLSLVSRLISIDRKNVLTVEKLDELGIEDEDDEETVQQKVRSFVKEIDALPPDQRVIRVKQDILREEKIYYELGPDFNIWWWTSNDFEKRRLLDAPPSIIENFKKRIGDRSEGGHIESI